MARLTRKLIETLEPREGDYSVRDTEVIGLGVRVRPSGVKTYTVTYRRSGQLRKLTLGRADEGYSVEEARDDLPPQKWTGLSRSAFGLDGAYVAQ